MRCSALFVFAPRGIKGERGSHEGERKPVGFQFLSGLLDQDEHLPSRYPSVTLELEIVAGLGEAVSGGSPYKSKDYDIDNDDLEEEFTSLDKCVDLEYTRRLIVGNMSRYRSQLTPPPPPRRRYLRFVL